MGFFFQGFLRLLDRGFFDEGSFLMLPLVALETIERESLGLLAEWQKGFPESCGFVSSRRGASPRASSGERLRRSNRSTRVGWQGPKVGREVVAARRDSRQCQT